MLGDTDGIEGSTVDLGSGRLLPVREVALTLASIVDPSIELGFGEVADRPLEQVRVADAEGTAARIGFRAEIGIEDGLRRTVEWYRERARIAASC